MTRVADDNAVTWGTDVLRAAISTFDELNQERDRHAETALAEAGVQELSEEEEAEIILAVLGGGHKTSCYPGGRIRPATTRCLRRADDAVRVRGIVCRSRLAEDNAVPSGCRASASPRESERVLRAAQECRVGRGAVASAIDQSVFAN